MKSKILQEALGRALTGEGAHVEAKNAFDGLDWHIAGTQPEGAPYTIFELLSHLIYWQDWVVKWLDGEDPPIPEHATESWPGEREPANASAWEQAVRRFGEGLDRLSGRVDEADLLLAGDRKTRLDMLQTIASHNSYHLGQVILLRRMLAAWPPPGGGLTW